MNFTTCFYFVIFKYWIPLQMTSLNIEIIHFWNIFDWFENLTKFKNWINWKFQISPTLSIDIILFLIFPKTPNHSNRVRSIFQISKQFQRKKQKIAEKTVCVLTFMTNKSWRDLHKFTGKKESRNKPDKYRVLSETRR